jgi:hypothetical protein
MSAKFYTLLTEIGAAKLASAAALGVPLKITQMAVDDGGGVLPSPSAQQTVLIAEKRRANLNMLYIDPQNSNQIIAEQVIPETEGGWWIREVGLCQPQQCGTGGKDAVGAPAARGGLLLSAARRRAGRSLHRNAGEGQWLQAAD